MTTSRTTSEDSVQNGHSLFVCRQLRGCETTEQILIPSHKLDELLAGNINHEWKIRECHDEHNTASLHKQDYVILLYRFTTGCQCESNFDDDISSSQYQPLSVSDKISSNSPEENYIQWPSKVLSKECKCRLTTRPCCRKTRTANLSQITFNCFTQIIRGGR